jgi:GcrA cell cycle regulator
MERKMNMAWHKRISLWPEQDKRLRELWMSKGEDGKPLSTVKISERMGISKYAVVGRAHRIGLPSRGSPIIKSPGGPRPYIARVPRGTSTLAPLKSLEGS